MKKRLLISTVIVGVIAIAVIGWTIDGLVWAFRPARPLSA
jgi:hypothetical protein